MGCGLLGSLLGLLRGRGLAGMKGGLGTASFRAQPGIRTLIANCRAAFGVRVIFTAPSHGYLVS